MKYRTIVIDPPWKIRSNLSKTMQGDYHQSIPYNMMTDDQILNFDIDKFADSECDLFMWCTHGKLPIALDIIKAWGFRYNFTLTWDKGGGLTQFGFHLNSEFVLYAYRGKRQLRYKGVAIKSVFTAPRGHHSEKPSIFYDAIKDKTAEPRIDIFARRRHAGFDAWGDQVEPVLQEVLV